MTHTITKGILVIFLFLLFPLQGFAQEKAKDESVDPFIRQLFTERTQLLLHDNPNSINHFYLPREKVSHYALMREQLRAKYIHTWASKRGVKITGADGDIRITRKKVRGDIAQISLIYSLKLTYTYADANRTSHSFGVGTRHGIKLKKVNDKWYVASEWYSDPIEEVPNNIPSDSIKNRSSVQPVTPQRDQRQTFGGKKRYNREKAVEYADKYAGAAWGAGNNHKYNPKYRDYNYLGGDCTNFASQVIGDKEEGGGLPARGGWYYIKKQGGSTAWVQTDAFKNFLVYSGYGKVIARGYYADVMKPSSNHPQGAMAKLEPGDLIGYEMNGDIDHFSVVVGRDKNGYVLVNSHSGDRYHVPWDIGWDKYTKFVLIHIRD
jgi:hypothetical protein